MSFKNFKISCEFSCRLKSTGKTHIVCGFGDKIHKEILRKKFVGNISKFIVVFNDMSFHHSKTIQVYPIMWITRNKA